MGPRNQAFQAVHLNGKIVHQVGLPWHWGYAGAACGCSANALTPHVGDANTMIPEYKAFLCTVEKSPVQYDQGEEYFTELREED